MADKPTGTGKLVIVAFLAAIGLPLAAGVTLQEQIARRPLVMLALLLLYEGLLLVFSVARGVWSHVERRWTKRLAHTLIKNVELLVSNYRSHYYQQLIYRHRTLDVKGLSTQGVYTLELEQVFVDLTIIPQPAHRVSTHILGLQRAIVPGKRYSIHDFLTLEDFKRSNIAIIGPPGSGKTTLLKHVALTLARKALPKQHRRTPFLIVLREHAEFIRTRRPSTLVELVEHSLKSAKIPAPEGWVKRELRRGKCFVMFDGLDEVADPTTRKLVAEWVDEQMQRYAGHRFLVTSRPFGFESNRLSQVSVFEVRPFLARQVRRFVHNWYLANDIVAAGRDDPGVRSAASEAADDFVMRLQRSPDLTELSVNPLLLTMMVTVHRYRSSLPGRRVELYSEILEVLLGKRAAAKGLTADITPLQKRRVLEPLAYSMMVGNRREIGRQEAYEVISPVLTSVAPKVTSDEFLQEICEQTGILVERENALYGFAHLTFQEYLAATHVQRHKLELSLVEEIDNSWWHETLRLFCAQGDASPIIQACISSEHPSIETLTLALECLEEAVEVTPEVRRRLEITLSASKSEDPGRLRARQKLKLRVRRLAHTDERFVLDDSLISADEYLLFAEDMRASGVDVIPEHLRGRMGRGAGSEPIAGVRLSDAEAFCLWLTDLHGNSRIISIPSADRSRLSPILIPDAKAPLRYWTRPTQGDQSEPLAIATDATDEGLTIDVVATIQADLAVVVEDSGLAGRIERAREKWGSPNVVSVNTQNELRVTKFGPEVNVDALLGRLEAFRGDEFGFRNVPSEIVPPINFLFSAAEYELSRDKRSALKRFCESLAECLVLRPKGANRTLELAIDLTRAIAELMPIEDDLSYLLPTINKMRARTRDAMSGLGAPQQSAAHRRMTAGILASVVPGVQIQAFQYTKEIKCRDDRSALRLLSLCISRVLKNCRDLDPRLPQLALDIFTTLSILEDRIAGELPAIESVRIVAETDHSETRT